MTATQLKTIRAKMGLTQVALAAELAVTPSTVFKWEQGIHPIPPSMAKLIDLIAKQKR